MVDLQELRKYHFRSDLCMAAADEITKLRQQRDELVAASKNLANQKGRYNTEVAYVRLMDVLAKIEGAWK